MTSTGLIVAAAVLVIGTAAGLWRRRTDGRLRSVGPAAASRSTSPTPEENRGTGPGEARESVAVGARSDIGAAETGRPTGTHLDQAASAAGASTGEPAAATELAASDEGAMPITGVSQPTGKAGATQTDGTKTDGTKTAAADPSAAGERLDAALLATLGVGPADATLLQFSSAFCAPCRAVRRVSSEVAELLPGVQHVEVDAESHLDAVRALGIWRTPTLLVLDADGRVTKRATGVPGKPQLIAVLGDILPTT